MHVTIAPDLTNIGGRFDFLPLFRSICQCGSRGTLRIGQYGAMAARIGQYGAMAAIGGG